MITEDQLEYETLTSALSQREREQEGRLAESAWRLNPAIPEETRATIRRNLIVQIERRLNP